MSRFSTLDLLGRKPVGEANRGPTPRSRCESGVTATSWRRIRSKWKVSKIYVMTISGCNVVLKEANSNFAIEILIWILAFVEWQHVFATHKFDNITTFDGRKSYENKSQNLSILCQ